MSEDKPQTKRHRGDDGDAMKPTNPSSSASSATDQPTQIPIGIDRLHGARTVPARKSVAEGKQVAFNQFPGMIGRAKTLLAQMEVACNFAQTSDARDLIIAREVEFHQKAAALMEVVGDISDSFLHFREMTALT